LETFFKRTIWGKKKHGPVPGGGEGGLGATIGGAPVVAAGGAKEKNFVGGGTRGMAEDFQNHQGGKRGRGLGRKRWGGAVVTFRRQKGGRRIFLQQIKSLFVGHPGGGGDFFGAILGWGNGLESPTRL